MNNIVQKLFGSSLIFGVGTAVQSVSMFLVLPLITSNTSIEQFGVYSLLLGVSSISNGIFYFGMASALPRFYYQFKSTKNRRKIFNIGLTISFLGAVLQILFFYILAICEVLERFKDFELSQKSYIYLAASNSIFMLNQYLLLKLRLDNKPLKFVLVNIAYSIFLAFSLYCLLQSNSDPLLEIFKSMFLASFMTFIIILAILYKQNINIQKFRFATKTNKKIIIFGFFQVLASLGQSLTETVDRFLISGFLALGDVGLYFAHSRTSAIVHMMLCVPFALIWSTVSMEIIHVAARKLIIKTVLTIYIYTGYIIVLMVGIFSEELFLFLFKQQNIQLDYFLFSVLSSAVVAAGATSIISVGLFYDQEIHKLAMLFYVVAILKGLILVLFLPVLGLAGAALGTLIANMLLLVFCHFLTNPGNKTLVDWKLLCRSTLAYLLCHLLIFHSVIGWSTQEKILCVVIILFCSVFSLRKFLQVREMLV